MSGGTGPPQLAGLAVVFGLLAAGCGGTNGSQVQPPPGTSGAASRETPPRPATAGEDVPVVTTPTPPELADGERLFGANCAACHGERARGTDHGPPFLHVVYVPSHHSDAAFQLAAANGVRAHHWSFGDMPPVPGVTPEEVTRIVAYVRWLQREGGIIP